MSELTAYKWISGDTEILSFTKGWVPLNSLKEGDIIVTENFNKIKYTESMMSVVEDSAEAGFELVYKDEYTNDRHKIILSKSWSWLIDNKKGQYTETSIPELKIFYMVPVEKPQTRVAKPDSPVGILHGLIYASKRMNLNILELKELPEIVSSLIIKDDVESSYPSLFYLFPKDETNESYLISFLKGYLFVVSGTRGKGIYCVYDTDEKIFTLLNSLGYRTSCDKYESLNDRHWSEIYSTDKPYELILNKTHLNKIPRFDYDFSDKVKIMSINPAQASSKVNINVPVIVRGHLLIK